MRQNVKTLFKKSNSNLQALRNRGEQMIVHLFNSSLVSGPETLVLPALANSNLPVEIWFLQESRLTIDNFRNPILYAESLGLKVRVIAVNSRWDNHAIANLGQLIISTQPELIHAHEVKASVYLGLSHLYLKYFGGKIIKNIYKHLQPIIVTTHHGVHARSRLMNRIYERIYCFFSAAIFDRIYTVCSSDVHLLKKIWFMPKHKVQLQLNGVTRKLICAQAKRELRLKYLKEWSEQTQQQLAESAIYLGIVARLSPEKNHLRIFSLFEQFLVKIAQQTDGLNSNTKIYLLVFGLGPLELKLKREVVKKGLENSILFLGYHQNMAEKIAAFDLLISLSKGEGLPINLIEAGWAGTAVVANAIDGNRDLLTLPEQGVLLESSLSDAEILKKLIAVIVYKENIERMGRSFQQHVQENFSEDKWLCNLKNSYQELGLKLEEAHL